MTIAPNGDVFVAQMALNQITVLRVFYPARLTQTAF